MKTYIHCLQERIAATRKHLEVNEKFYSCASIDDYMDAVLRNQIVIMKALVQRLR